MSESPYKSKQVQKLEELCHRWEEAMKGGGSGNMMMKMIGMAIVPSIPSILQMLDGDEELRERLLRKIIEVVEELKNA